MPLYMRYKLAEATFSFSTVSFFLCPLFSLAMPRAEAPFFIADKESHSDTRQRKCNTAKRKKVQSMQESCGHYKGDGTSLHEGHTKSNKNNKNNKNNNKTFMLETLPRLEFETETFKLHQWTPGL